MIKRFESIGFWLALGILGVLALAVLPHRATTAEVENAHWLEHSHRVIERIGDLEQRLYQAQNIRRGFALTGDADLLAAFASVAKELREAESGVRALTADNPQQQQRLDRLEPLLDAWRARLEAAIALRQADGFVLAQEAGVTRELEALFRRITLILAELHGEEGRLLVERDVRVTNSTTHARWVHIVGTGASVIVILFAFAALRSENKRRRRSELGARVSEENLAATLESIGDGVIATDTAGLVVRMNAVAEQLTGWSDGAVGRPLSEVFHVVDEATRVPCEAAFEQAITERSVVAWARERLLVRRDGTERVVTGSAAPIHDAEGKITGVVLAFHDVTMEREAARKLEKSEARFARLADSGIVGITISDLNGRFSEANDAFLEMIGYSRDDLAGGKLSAAAITPAELRMADQEATRTLTKTGAIALREKEYVRKDGSRVPVLVGGALVTEDECIGFIADISNRNRAEEALRTSEMRFRRLMESGIMGIVLSDTEGNITEANDAFLAMVGYSRQDLLEGKVRGETLNTPDRDRTDANARAHLAAHGFAPPWEKELVTKDGVRVPVLTGVTMLDGPNSMALVVDLTERKRAQEAIRQLLEQHAVDASFRALLEAAPDAIVIADADACIVLVNAQAERLFGYSREEMLGNPARMLVPDRKLAEHVDRWGDYLSDAPVRPMGATMELYGLRKDGTEVPIEVSHAPLQTEQGRLISSFIRDITERRRAEENLRQSEERFRLLVESVKDYAILMLDPDGRVASWNAGAERIKGYAADEIVGRSFTAFYPRDQRERALSELREAAAEGQLQDEGWRLRKDGSRFWANVLITAVRDASGTLVGFAKVTRDLSERRRAEQALELANRELESFSYSVAHDLRAPLRGMNGFAQVLLDGYRDKLDAEGQDWLNEILLNARKMGALIDALLSLARVTRSELKRERVDLSSVIRAAAARLAAAEPARSVELVVEDALWADVDIQLTRALVENLLENAWKFTGKNVAAPRIEAGVTENDGTRAFFVRDNGAGFDMAFASKLFGAFQRLHTESEFPGTGIGLATVQRIVHRHGGRIWAEGEVDKGATFYFTMPGTTIGTTT